MTTPAPKPCPFCGQPVKIEDVGTESDYPQWRVACWERFCPCNPRTPWLDSEEHALESWNYRHDS